MKLGHRYNLFENSVFGRNLTKNSKVLGVIRHLGGYPKKQSFRSYTLSSENRTLWLKGKHIIDFFWIPGELTMKGRKS